MVLNDVSDHEAYFRTVAAAARPGARLVFSLNNPYTDAATGKVDDYYSVGESGVTPGLSRVGVHTFFYHRPLSEYVRAAMEAGLTLGGC